MSEHRPPTAYEPKVQLCVGDQCQHVAPVKHHGEGSAHVVDEAAAGWRSG